MVCVLFFILILCFVLFFVCIDFCTVFCFNVVFCLDVSLSRDLFCLHLVGEGGPLAVDEVGKRIRLQRLCGRKRLYSHPHQALRASFSHRVKPFFLSRDQREQFTRPKGAIHATIGSNSCDHREQFMRPTGAIHATIGSNSRCVSNNS